MSSNLAQKPCRIDRKDFFTILSDREMIRLVKSQFLDELERLKRARAVSKSRKTPPPTPSPSQSLFGSQYDEINRTFTSIAALRWIYNGEYDTFCRSQPEASVLTLESFSWMQRVFKTWIRNRSVFIALITSIVIKYLGKDPQLVTDYRLTTGKDVSANNHTLILLKAVEDDVLPCMDRLAPGYKDDVLRGLKLGAQFNFGQLAQAEIAPVSISALLEFRGHQRAFELYFMEQLLGVAGAGGHEDWTCALKLTQSVFDAYRNVYDAAQTLISGWISLQNTYDFILLRRSQLLHKKGFRQLDVTNAEDRALMRLLCMGKVADLSTAQLYDSVWKEDLKTETKASLVADLNIDGSVDQPAVQATYAPALLTRGMKAGGSESNSKRRERVRCLLNYLARVFSLTDTTVDDSAVVIERNLSKVVQTIVGSEEFRTYPAILEKKEVPDGIGAKIARDRRPSVDAPVANGGEKSQHEALEADS